MDPPLPSTSILHHLTSSYVTGPSNSGTGCGHELRSVGGLGCGLGSAVVLDRLWSWNSVFHYVSMLNARILEKKNKTHATKQPVTLYMQSGSTILNLNGYITSLRPTARFLGGFSIFSNGVHPCSSNIIQFQGFVQFYFCLL
jgi:hypothetical protein